MTFANRVSEFYFWELSFDYPQDSGNFLSSKWLQLHITHLGKFYQCNFLYLISLGCNCIYFINENDSWRVFFCLLKSCWKEKETFQLKRSTSLWHDSVPDKRWVLGQNPDGNRYLIWHWRRRQSAKVQYSYKSKYYTLCNPPEKLHDPLPKKIT